jgi:hypothetical protein
MVLPEKKPCRIRNFCPFQKISFLALEMTKKTLFSGFIDFEMDRSFQFYSSGLFQEA